MTHSRSTGSTCEAPPDDDEVFEALHQDLIGKPDNSPWLEENILEALENTPKKFAMISAYLREGDYSRAGSLMNDTTCVYWGEQTRKLAEHKYGNLMRAAKESAEASMLEFMRDIRQCEEA